MTSSAVRMPTICFIRCLFFQIHLCYVNAIMRRHNMKTSSTLLALCEGNSTSVDGLPSSYATMKKLWFCFLLPPTICWWQTPHDVTEIYNKIYILTIYDVNWNITHAHRDSIMTLNFELLSTTQFCGPLNQIAVSILFICNRWRLSRVMIHAFTQAFTYSLSLHLSFSLIQGHIHTITRSLIFVVNVTHLVAQPLSPTNSHVLSRIIIHFVDSHSLMHSFIHTHKLSLKFSVSLSHRTLPHCNRSFT